MMNNDPADWVYIHAGTRPDEKQNRKGKSNGPGKSGRYNISASGETAIKIVTESHGEASGAEKDEYGLDWSIKYDLVRYGEIEMSAPVTLEVFETALDSGMKLSKPETQRLLAKIIQASAVFDD